MDNIKILYTIFLNILGAGGLMVLKTGFCEKNYLTNRYTFEISRQTFELLHDDNTNRQIRNDARKWKGGN